MSNNSMSISLLSSQICLNSPRKCSFKACCVLISIMEAYSSHLNRSPWACIWNCMIYTMWYIGGTPPPPYVTLVQKSRSWELIAKTVPFLYCQPHCWHVCPVSSLSVSLLKWLEMSKILVRESHPLDLKTLSHHGHPRREIGCVPVVFVPDWCHPDVMIRIFHLHSMFYSWQKCRLHM